MSDAADRPRTVEELVRSRLSAAAGRPAGLPRGRRCRPSSSSSSGPSGHDFATAVWVTAAVVAVLLAARLLQRQTPRFVLSSLVAAAIAAYFVHRSGRAQDAFLPGILYSAGVGALTLLSVLVRWPLIGSSSAPPRTPRTRWPGIATAGWSGSASA